MKTLFLLATDVFKQKGTHSELCLLLTAFVIVHSTHAQVFDLLVDLLAGNYNIQHDQTFGILEIRYQIK